MLFRSDFTESGNDDETLADSEVLSRLIEWDSVNKDFTIAIVNAVAEHENAATSYMQYKYDSNDHFVEEAEDTEGTGTAVTMAAWEKQMAANVTVAGTGTFGDVALIDYEALSTGISQFSEGND